MRGPREASDGSCRWAFSDFGPRLPGAGSWLGPRGWPVVDCPGSPSSCDLGRLSETVGIIWYHLAGHSPAIARDRRDRAPWYATKTCPAYIDMITKLRRVLIAAQFHPGVPR